MDPLSEAIADYLSGTAARLIVHSDLADDDEMDVSYYFRSENDLPEIEKKALGYVSGKILDVGAAVGAHSIPLMNKGFDVLAIDTCPIAVDYLIGKKVHAKKINFFDFEDIKFDTLLFLMNGIGIAESIDKLDLFLQHCRKLLNTGGIVILDTTDVKYFYEDDEGGFWIDLNAKYYGEFKYQFSYGEHKGDWFNWLYIDPSTLEEYAIKNKFSFEILFENEVASHYLIKLTKQS